MELSRLLEDLVAAGAPGAAIRVDDGREIFREARGVADLRTGRPMDVDLRFRAGSATKAFVAAVVLQLVAERQLALGDPIERWLPGITPQGRRIVVRHLLEHSSGLPDYLPAIARVVHDSERACMHTWTPRELVALVAHQPLLFAPGTAWAYANTGYVLLGLLVEAVTGASLADELARRICRSTSAARHSRSTRPRFRSRWRTATASRPIPPRSPTSRA